MLHLAKEAFHPLSARPAAPQTLLICAQQHANVVLDMIRAIALQAA